MIKSPTIEKLIEEDEQHYCKNNKEICVKMVSLANLPTRFGNFKVVAFYNNHDKKEHAAILKGNICGKGNVPLRVHSECLTGDAIGSLRCDCRDQLETALKMIGKMKYGALLYLRQEGRGIGFINKIRAYQLQDNGYDTIEANEALGFKADERDYGIAAHMIRSLNIKSIKLISNNPHKIQDLQFYGTKISGRIPIVIKPNVHNKFYLETKKKKAGHIFDRIKSISKFEQADNLLNSHNNYNSTKKK